MATFVEANRARLSLKMNLSNYAWYNSIGVQMINNDWCLVVVVNNIDNKVKKTVPVVYDGISVKTEVFSRLFSKKQK